MPDRINPHVSRLSRFLPFDPSHDQIYEEYQVAGDSLNLETKAFDYVLKAAIGGARMIVLTGDAGHGKTHLCRRIIESFLHYNEDEARDLINTKCDGKQSIPAKEGGTDKALRIFKDYSEFAPDIAAELVEKTKEINAVTIICANEGRLRAVLSSKYAGSYCAEILERFESSFEDGRASQDGLIHIVNLNYQSTASGERGQSLGDRALREWTSGTRWRSCSDCDYQSSCPILHNRKMLSEKSDVETAPVRKRQLRLLLATLERIGYVITIRDMLMTIAYLLTGGLKCEDVHKFGRSRRAIWQNEFAFYNLVFAAPSTLTQEQLRRLPLMQQLPKLDPGRRANREVDERIVNEQGIFDHGQLDLRFSAPATSSEITIDAADGIDEIIGDPRNKKQRANEARNVKLVVRALRRRAFIDGMASAQSDMSYLGFPYGAEFLSILDGSLDAPARTKLKRRVIAGLHHIQGLQFSESTPILHLVDPAFGRSMSGTAILATKINPSEVDLVRLSEKWGKSDDIKYHISGSVDWIDRHIVLKIIDQRDIVHHLLLDLMTFDCILRAAAGHVPTKFYEHDIRRVASFLGQIAQSSPSNSNQINLIKDGRSQTISIDGSTIQVGAGA